MRSLQTTSGRIALAFLPIVGVCSWLIFVLFGDHLISYTLAGAMFAAWVSIVLARGWQRLIAFALAAPAFVAARMIATIVAMFFYEFPDAFAASIGLVVAGILGTALVAGAFIRRVSWRDTAYVLGIGALVSLFGLPMALSIMRYPLNPSPIPVLLLISYPIVVGSVMLWRIGPAKHI